MQNQRAMGRIWPNGEFVLWTETAREIVDPEQASPFGLSELPNSHSESDMSERVRRGLGGITVYGQRMVKNAAYLLQKKHGARRLSFLTCTIPGSPEDTLGVAEVWSDVCRTFYQKVKRSLIKEGLSPVIVGVTEIQPKRFQKTGGMPLHLHLVFQGAFRDNIWCFKPSQFEEMWRETLTAIYPDLACRPFSSATNVQRVKDNAAGYLGKYMSKGAGDIQAILEKCPTVVDALPSSWYNMTKEARDAVKRHTRYGPEVGDMLEEWRKGWGDGMNPFRFLGLGQIKIRKARR